jgi:hypothetical protein
MSRSFRCGILLSRAHVLATIGVAVGCGMRGPPLPPLVFVPAAVTTLEIQRLDGNVFIRLKVPAGNTDGSEPADLERVEVYALTTSSDPDQPVRQLPLEDWLDHATMVATIPVVATASDAPPDADSETAPPKTVHPGDEVTLVEVLTLEAVLPVAIESETADEEEAELVEPDNPDNLVRAAPFVVPPPPPPARRTYLAIGVSTSGRESSPSPRISVTLADPGSAPGAPTVTYTETELVVEWVAPTTARRPIQAPAIDAALESEPVVGFPPATRYLVYAVETAADTVTEDAVAEIETERPEPISPQPVTETSYVDAGVTFGAERCYMVRALDVVDSLQVRGPASSPTCVTPVDTFAPQPPSGVVAVASRDAISLVWDQSPEPDVAGYLVLRGTAPGATLQSLTAEPIAETTYRDAAVEPDRRYVYAVQAVDDVAPPNVSPPSVEVIEQAR